MASIITNVGLAKLATASPLTPLEITHVAFGDNGGVWPKLLDPNATSLTNEVYRSDSSDPIKDPLDDTVLIFEGVIPGDEGGWTLREVAMFDVDGDMIAIGDIDQLVKPAPGSGSLMILTQAIEVKFSSTTDVTLIAQDVAVLDHQGLSNRSAVDAHPASSISTLALTAIGQGVSNVQSILDLLKSAALRAVGTGGSDISDNTQLNARLGTSGNLGDAAQLTAQTSKSDSTTGRVLLVGAGGLLDDALNAGNFNSLTSTRFFGNDSPNNAPEGASITNGVSITSPVVGDYTTQMVVVNKSQNIYHRSGFGDWYTPVPPGSRIIYEGDAPPNGYLEENGALVNRVLFSALFDAIGTKYGIGDGSTTFELPTRTDADGIVCIKY